jgi:hypothetical protein
VISKRFISWLCEIAISKIKGQINPVIKKLIAAFIIIVACSNLTGAGVPSSDSNALKEFDTAVSLSRMEMRQYCALVQN